MITLYTALGSFKFKKSSTPDHCCSFIVKNNQEFGLTVHEFVLWAILYGNIFTYEELHQKYSDRLEDLSLTSELDFDHYLKRLTFRGLIASATNYTRSDTFNDLLGKLALRPKKPASLKRPRLGSPFSPVEKVILNHARQGNVNIPLLFQDIGNRSVVSAAVAALYKKEEIVLENQ